MLNVSRLCKPEERKKWRLVYVCIVKRHFCTLIKSNNINTVCRYDIIIYYRFLHRPCCMHWNSWNAFNLFCDASNVLLYRLLPIFRYYANKIYSHKHDSRSVRNANILTWIVHELIYGATGSCKYLLLVGVWSIKIVVPDVPVLLFTIFSYSITVRMWVERCIKD